MVAWVRRVDRSVLRSSCRLHFPASTFFVCIGVYGTHNSLADVAQVAVFQHDRSRVPMLRDFPVSPIMLGCVLGPMLGENVRRAPIIFGAYSSSIPSARRSCASCLQIAGQAQVAPRALGLAPVQGRRRSRRFASGTGRTQAVEIPSTHLTVSRDHGAVQILQPHAIGR